MAHAGPTKRTERLLVVPLDGELLVYDLDGHRAHALEARAAAVWNACDGRTDVAAIASAAAADGQPLPEELVPIVLERLARARLLERDGPAPSTSRRDLLRRAAALGGLAVTSIVVPTAAFAASCLKKNTCVSPSCRDATGSQCCGGCAPQTGNKCKSEPFTYLCQ